MDAACGRFRYLVGRDAADNVVWHAKAILVDDDSGDAKHVVWEARGFVNNLEWGKSWVFSRWFPKIIVTFTKLCGRLGVDPRGFVDSHRAACEKARKNGTDLPTIVNHSIEAMMPTVHVLVLLAYLLKTCTSSRKTKVEYNLRQLLQCCTVRDDDLKPDDSACTCKIGCNDRGVCVHVQDYPAKRTSVEIEAAAYLMQMERAPVILILQTHLKVTMRKCMELHCLRLFSSAKFPGVGASPTFIIQLIKSQKGSRRSFPRFHWMNCRHQHH